MIERTNTNLDMNQFTHYKICHFAVGNHDGEAVLNVPKGRHSLGSIAFEPSRVQTSIDQINVKVRPLSDIIEGFSASNALMKIDAEGSEYEIFQGIDHDLADCFKAIIFEFSKPNLQRAGCDPFDLFTLGWIDNFTTIVVNDETGDITAAEKDTLPEILANQDGANILLLRK